MASAVEQMQKLVWKKQYNAFHYLQMLKRLMPLGPIWRFPLFDCSAEALGSDWVYLNTFVEEDFDNGQVPDDPFWSSQLIGLAQITMPTDGDGIIHTNSGAQLDWDIFSGKNISGTFDFEASFKLSDTYDAGTYVRFGLKTATYNDTAEAYWDASASSLYMRLNYLHGGPTQVIAGVPFAALKEVKFRFKRSAGLITYQYDVGAGWIDGLNSFSESDDIVRADMHSTLNTPGLGYFKFQADSGFPYGNLSEQSMWALLLSCFATELSWFEGRVTTLLTEMVPALASELLTDWETMAGLPDECSALGATEVERQNTVHEKITAQYTYMSEQFYIDYAAALGVTITIEVCGAAVYDARCGIARCGVARCANLDTMFWWRVILPIGHPMNSTIECLFQKMKPAETYLCFAYV